MADPIPTSAATPTTPSTPMESGAITDSEPDDDVAVPMNNSNDKDDDENKEEAVFVNHGFLLWESSRKDWLDRSRRALYAADSSSDEQQQRQNTIRSAKSLPVDDIIDIIFASPKQWREQGGPQAFPTHVPLPQMIDILQDLWEAEGLDV